MIETMKDAEAFIKRLGCSSYRKKQFMLEVYDVLIDNKDVFTDYDKAQDYIDSLRRAPYVGMGI